MTTVADIVAALRRGDLTEADAVQQIRAAVPVTDLGARHIIAGGDPVIPPPSGIENGFEL